FPGSRAEYRRWRRAQLAAWFTHRTGILSCWAPGLLPWEVRQDGWKRYTDRGGWMGYLDRVTPEQYHFGLEHARREYAESLGCFRIPAVPDRALRELLAVCRREGVAVALVVAPEGSTFRGWYPPAARAQIDAYLAGLAWEWAVPVVDARTWVADDA